MASKTLWSALYKACKGEMNKAKYMYILEKNMHMSPGVQAWLYAHMCGEKLREKINSGTFL